MWDQSAAAYAACLHQLEDRQCRASYAAQLAAFTASDGGSPEGGSRLPLLTVEELEATCGRLATEAALAASSKLQGASVHPVTGLPAVTAADCRALAGRAAAALLRLLPSHPEALLMAVRASWMARAGGGQQG